MRLPSRRYTDRVIQKSHEEHTEVQLLKFIPPTSSSNIYREAIGKTYGTPIAFKCYLEANPSELKLQDMGWSKEQAGVILRVAYKSLLDNGLISPDGDLLFTQEDRLHIPHLNDTYQISLTQLREPFVDGLPTFVWIAGKKFIHG